MGCTGSSLSLIHAQTLRPYHRRRERGSFIRPGRRGGGGCTRADRVNHSNTLMGTKTPITERASELAAPFAPHMEGGITVWEGTTTAQDGGAATDITE